MLYCTYCSVLCFTDVKLYIHNALFYAATAPCYTVPRCIVHVIVISSHPSLSCVSLLVFTGDKSLVPQGIVPIPPEMTANEMTHEMLRLSIPLVLNFNKRNQPLIHTLPIKVRHSAAVNNSVTSMSH